MRDNSISADPPEQDCETAIEPRRSLLSRVDLLTLKLFTAIIEEQSIAKAAKRENIATSAVRKRILDLEHSLGLTLLTRHHRGIESTPAGRSLLHHARTILRDVAQLENELFDYASGVRGHVRVFANESTIFGYLPEELREFLAEHPMVHVDFEAKVSPDIVKAITESAADIGLFAGDIPTGELKVFPYHRDRLVAVVPEGHPLASRGLIKLVELLEHELIDQERGSSIELILLRAASALGRPIKVRIRVGSFDAMCRMVEAGLGIGVVPDRFADRIMKSLNVRKVILDEAWAARQHKICVRDIDNLPNAARLLLQHLVRKADGTDPSQTATPASPLTTSQACPRG